MKLEFHGTKLTSDAGLLAYRELDEALGLTTMIESEFYDDRTGKNTQHSVAALLRQSIYGRLAGYDNTNDAERLSVDPAIRQVVGGRAKERTAAPTSLMGRFEMEILTQLYAIRLKANVILYDKIEHLLTRPVGRPPKKPIVLYESFQYRVASWDKPRRVVVKTKWYAGELFPRVGFIVTSLRWKSSNVVKFYNKRGTAEQWIKEGKYALNWTRLSCHDFIDNQVRLQLFALAYNLDNFLKRLALPRRLKDWSLRTLKEKLIKIGAKVVRHSRYIIFQMAEVAVSRALFCEILDRIRRLRLVAASSGAE